MHVVVLGLWHLGSVTAACLARHHQVTGLDFDEAVISNLRSGRAPLHEPGLDDLIAAGVAKGNLDFSNDVAVTAKAKVLWVCYDTPVDADDRSNLDWVHSQLDRVLPVLVPETLVLLSSQLPVGTCARLEKQHPLLQFACSPENLRLGKAIEAFEKPARIVLGVRGTTAKLVLEELVAPLKVPALWMRTESAEMVKHALNSFLALSIAFINEIAILSETMGADAQEVAAGLKSDQRIGPKAYLGPGGPFAGGTLARDVVTLSTLGERHGLTLSLIPAIKISNDHHRDWARHKIQTVLAGVAQPVVAVLGLAYTPNTNTLRRSVAVELCRNLVQAGFVVQCYDPLIRTTDPEHADLLLMGSADAALRNAHAVVICTEWMDFRDYRWTELLASMARPIVVDANRFIEKAVISIPGTVYLTVGRP